MAETDDMALGLVETRGLTAALEAADAMLKAARVRLLAAEQTVPALITVQVVGEVAAVQASVEAGRHAAERVGEVVSVHVIPRPAGEVRALLARTLPAPMAAESGGREALEAMTVKALRAQARETEGLALQGRAVSRASKSELVDALYRHGWG